MQSLPSGSHIELGKARKYQGARLHFSLCYERHLDTPLTKKQSLPILQKKKDLRALVTKLPRFSHPFLHLVHLTGYLDLHHDISCTHVMVFLEPLKMFGDAQSWHKILIMNLGCPSQCTSITLIKGYCFTFLPSPALIKQFIILPTLCLKPSLASLAFSLRHFGLTILLLHISDNAALSQLKKIFFLKLHQLL